MKPHARIGHRGAVHLERGLQSSRKREKRGHLPLLRGIPARVKPDGMKRDDQHPADKRGAIIHFPIRIRLDEGYGKLLLRVEDVDSHGDAIAQRRAAGVPCDKLKSFCRMTVRNHRDVVERRHFVFSVVHQLQFDGV